MAVNGYVAQASMAELGATHDLTCGRHSQPRQSPEQSEASDPNYAASLSNAENSLSSLPSKPLVTAPPTEEAPPVQPPPDTIDTADGPHPEQGALSLPSDTAAPEPSHSLTPQPPINGSAGEYLNLVTASSELLELPRPLTVTSTSEISYPQISELQQSSEPVPLPAQPAELSMLETAADTIQPLSQPPLGVDSLLNQAPTSDVRHSPSPAARVDVDREMVMDHTESIQQLSSSLEAPTQIESSFQATESMTSIPEAETQATLDSSDKMDLIIEPPIVNTEKLPSPPPAPQPPLAALPQLDSTEILPEAPFTIPIEHPPAPTPTPVEPVPAEADQAMPDVASPPTKTIHERDDDGEEEHVAKRARTEEASEQGEFKIPQAPSAPSTPVTNGEPMTAFADDDVTITAPRLAHMKKTVSNLKKSNASRFFRLPVDHVALGIPTYPDIIKNPMDLGTVDNKLKNGDYSKVNEFVADFDQIITNAVTFNGREHPVTAEALKMQVSFHSQMKNLPKATIAEPTKEEKRAQKLKIEPTRTAPPRRPSVSTVASAAGPARSPGTAGGNFALGPDGVPLIRRDSTINDGRPKRAIIPTKRNDDLGSGRPKKKKYELQLRFCAEVLKEIASPKHWQINQFFIQPVDPVALNIPSYFSIIKKPMDMQTIEHKLESNQYEKAKDFEEDVRLIFKNCFKFNPETDWVNQAGHKLEELFDKRWQDKDNWIAAREPASEPQSEGEEDDDDDGEDSDEADDEEDDSDDDRQQKIRELQKQIEMMSQQMGELAHPKKKKKKSKSPASAAKKSSKSSKSNKKDKAASSTFPNLKTKDKDSKKDKKEKPKPKPEKEKYYAISLAEKQYISNGISQLPDKQMTEALKIIQQNVPSLKNTHETEIELDIDEVPNHVLHKLLNFVKKYAGPPPQHVESEPAPVYAAAPAHGGVGRPKKSKPMSKETQEAEIAELKGRLGQYEKQVAAGGGRGTGSPSDHSKFLTPPSCGQGKMEE